MLVVLFIILCEVSTTSLALLTQGLPCPVSVHLAYDVKGLIFFFSIVYNFTHITE